MRPRNQNPLWRKQLIETITLLWTLKEVPGTSMENDPPEIIKDTYQLTFEHEREIVDNLAFISATIDDTHHIMAIGIEEHRDGEGMTIRLASNSGVLPECEMGFKRIATVLEQASSRGL